MSTPPRPARADDAITPPEWRHLATVLAVSRALRAWRRPEHGAGELLRAFAEAMELPAASLWAPESDVLTVRSVWCTPGADRATLERGLRRLRLPRGAGLAGSAWEQRKPVNRPLNGVAAFSLPPGRLGVMRAALCVPALAGDDVPAVVELYALEDVELDARLTEVLCAVGEDIGAHFARGGQLAQTPLTARELEVLTLVADGLGSAGIAGRLSISPATVKTHLEHVFAKLGVPNRASAVARALRTGLIE